MEKTKLGISIGLFGAGLYFCGIVGIIPLVLLAGYVLLKEQNPWLRRTAVKVMAIVLAFAALRAGVDIFNGAFDSINSVFGIVGSEAYLSFPSKVTALLDTLLNLLENILLLVGGIHALSGRELKVDTIDKVVDKNM